eukprot:comp5437_c0_seq1/m.1406 comp5437_c0_seq1/g.1406  ORF comp5437_c0_seq1/g.1406 comp5437_c0_seq1/m.1406 type:complete len:311 (-) comp5437_c0_seq1:165-1097(-)
MYSALRPSSHLSRCAFSLLTRSAHAHTTQTRTHTHTFLRTQQRLLSHASTSASIPSLSVTDTQEIPPPSVTHTQETPPLHPNYLKVDFTSAQKAYPDKEKRIYTPVRATSDPRLITHQLRYLVSKGKKQEAWRLFDQLRQRNSANVFHFSVILRLCSDNWAWELFQDMCNRGIAPNDYIYSSLLQSCCYTKNIELAKTIMEDMRLRGIRPTAPIYNALIKVLTAAKEYDSVKEVAKNARKLVMFDVVTYNSLLVAYAQQEDLESMKVLLVDMHKEGLKPDLVTYDIMLRAFKSAGEEQAVTALLAALQVS